YFITRLLKDVVFAEAGIVSTNRRVERRNLWIRRAAYALSAAIVLGMGALWLTSYYGNMALIESVEDSVAKYNEEIRGVTLSSFDDSDLKSVLPPLGTLRGMPTGYAERDKSAPLSLNFGLYQGDKLGFQAVDAYRRSLNGLLLPRILGRLERDLRANLARPDYLYEALKVYLMLGRQGPLDIAFVKQWMVLQWANAYPAPGEQPMREALAQHLAALLATPLSEVPLDTGLIQQTRQILLQTPLAARAYGLIVHGPNAAKLLEWNALNAGGAETDRVFVRRSGKPLTEGIPGIYTVEGFHRVVLLDVKDIAREVAKESWVLGAANEHKPTLEETAKLEKDVLSLYMTDFAGKWDAVLGDLTIVPLGSLGQTVEVLNILSGPASPLRRLLTEISRQTTLSKTPGVLPGSAGDTAKVAVKEGITEAQSAAKTLEAQSATAARLATIVGGSPQAAALPGKEVDDRYKALHDLVAGTPSGLDRVITMLSALYEQLSRTSMATDQAQAMTSSVLAGAAGPAAQLAAEAGRLPAPLRSWAEAVVKGNSSVTVKGARERINAAWKSNVLPFCQKALDNRYPIVRSSAADVTIDDFSRLFAPGGLIDGFFDGELKSFVNMTERSWRWQRVENVDVGSSNDALLQFQRAAAIRDSLFAGAKAPHMRFTVTPLSLDAGATQVLLSIDGQAVTYKHGPPIATQLQWPGTTGVAEARVAFSAGAADVATTASPLSISLSGPWSLFRLLDKATVARSTLSEKMTVTFALGGHSASFELDANSVVNPFMLDALERFRCPPSL
ncbi:MAG: type VI secretion system membrane subunit TssM, partial [Alphaproteobacteria bacterium]